MKRLVSIGAIAVLSFFSAGLIMAQSDPFIGTWQLNLAKSKYQPGPAPKSQTRIWESSGDGQKVTVNSVDATGSQRVYGYWIKADGKDYPISGQIINGSDVVSIKRVDANTIQATYKKAGKKIGADRFVISKDGKVETVEAHGTYVNGQAFHNITVWDKQ